MPNSNYRLIHVPTNDILATEVRMADSFFRRLKGLMFSKNLPVGQALLIQPCQQIHTHFMRYPIDVIFADKQLNVLHVIPAMAPWRFSKYIKQSHCVIELPVGTVEKVKVGDVLSLELNND